ncbi:hypothetical protein SAMN02745221_02177 [Thermosyntropha lipolytica DSM 11003]|uniref:Uncharacterized protein n=1 Tax=Thermosyntropha lipolytica DSM 11003 TaxID=1123382 RepID=A0A1M5S8A0_9FIRM|nr:hypothetical protein [Thermosyntropha lipolytica]SHH34153.1 hypothetical protein SAMN02745221_02177 [Thermosyntropha lipolytica DSM 11003]
MQEYKEGSKKIEINIRISEFEVPPIQDVLVVGKKAPIGPEAARRMVDVLSPDQYDILKIEHPFIEAVIIRKALCRIISPEKIIKIIIEESEKIMDEDMLIKMQLDISLQISKVIDL